MRFQKYPVTCGQGLYWKRRQTKKTKHAETISSYTVSYHFDLLLETVPLGTPNQSSLAVSGDYCKNL